ncbi:hypothetical protein D9M71_680400 [compost metagenome]
MIGRLEGFAAAVAEDHPPAGAELIALGMAAEVVVVLEDQNLRSRVFLAVEERCRQAADAAADHHQVVLFADRQGVGDEGFFLPAHLVRNVESAGVTAAQTGQGRWVVAPAGGSLKQLQRGQARCNADGDSVDEVASGDFHGCPYLNV